jgi:two-component system KDP operon response regulator KdpE
VLFTVPVGAIGSLIAIMKRKYQNLRRVDVLVRNESNSRQEKENRTEDGVFTAGDIEVDLSRRLVKLRRQILKLTPKEYELLSYLIRNSGRVVSHKDILHNVWGPEYNGENEYLRTFVRQLRHKIEDDPSHPQFIVTEQGIGYRFVMPVEHPR